VAYCAESDVQIACGGLEKLAQLSDQDGALSGAVNHAVVTSAITEATAEMASYIGHRISVNAVAAAVPDVVKMKAASWAVRVLRRNLYNGQPLSDDIEREAVDREWLKDVAKGLVSLGVQPELPAAPEITDKAAPRDSTLSISRLKLRGYA
jgi:phage gp36-like protein